MKKLALFGSIAPAVCLALAMSAAAQTPTLIAVNQGNATASVIDPVSERQIADIPEDVTGVHAHEAAVSPDGRTLYLPVYGSTGVGKPGIDGHQMLVVDLATRRIVHRVDFGHGVRPHCVLYDRNSGLLYVTTELDEAVTVIDPKTLDIVAKIPTSQPQSHMLALTRDGKRGYTANVGPGTVSVLDMVAHKTIAVIPISAETQRISISRDDSMVFTSDQTRPRLAVIDTATSRVKTWVTLPGTGYGTASTHDGRWLLVAIPKAGKVAVVNLQTLKVERTIDVPPAPQEILIRPDGRVAYVSCNASGKVAAIDLADWKVRSLISAGPGVDGLAWAK